MKPGSSARPAPKLRKPAVNVVLGPDRMPARPPSRAAMPQVSIETRRTLIPTSSAAVDSCCAAWIARPEGERKNSASPIEATTRTPKVISCCTVTGALNGGTRK